MYTRKVKLHKFYQKRHGKKMSIERLIRLTGLTEKSIRLYTSRNGYGSIKSGFLNFA